MRAIPGGGGGGREVEHQTTLSSRHLWGFCRTHLVQMMSGDPVKTLISACNEQTYYHKYWHGLFPNNFQISSERGLFVESPIGASWPIPKMYEFKTTIYYNFSHFSWGYWTQVDSFLLGSLKQLQPKGGWGWKPCESLSELGVQDGFFACMEHAWNSRRLLGSISIWVASPSGPSGCLTARGDTMDGFHPSRSSKKKQKLPILTAKPRNGEHTFGYILLSK